MKKVENIDQMAHTVIWVFKKKIQFNGGYCLKYCCSESERIGTYYHEFQKGRFNGTFWDKDSLLISDDNLYNLNLAAVFKNVVPSYDECGETEITQEQWNKIYIKASEIGGEIKIAIDEINCWAQTVFQDEKVFTILGL